MKNKIKTGDTLKKTLRFMYKHDIFYHTIFHFSLKIEYNQLSDEEKNAVPEHIQKAAREMGQKAFQEKLREIGMSGYDHSIYSQFSNAVAKQVQSLRVILGNIQAKNKERQWYRHQTSGELDDIKLIDGKLFFVIHQTIDIVCQYRVSRNSA